MAIFVPAGFYGGIVGRFMTSFGFTMSFAILGHCSLSFTLTPMLAARWIKMKPRRLDSEGRAIEEQSSKGLLDLQSTGRLVRVDAELVARAPWIVAIAVLGAS